MAEKRYTVVFDAKDMASSRLSAMEQQAKKTSRGMDELADKTKTVSAATSELDGSYRDANGRLRDANGKFLKMSDAVKKTNEEMSQSSNFMTRLGSGFNRIGDEGRSAVGRLSTGLGGVIGLLGSVTAAAGVAGVALGGLAVKGIIDGMISPAMTAEMTQMSITGLSGSPELGKQIYDLTKAKGMESMFADQPFMDTAQVFLNNTKDPQEIVRGLNITERLATKNPSVAMGGGMEGAKVAISEVMAGDMTSIAERFNTSRSTLAAAGVSSSHDWLTNLEAVDRLLSEQGFTKEYVDQINESTTGQWEKLKSNAQGVFATVGKGMLDELRPAFKEMNTMFDDKSGMDRFTSTMSGKFRDALKDVLGLGDGVQITWDDITQWSSDTFDGIVDLVDAVGGSFSTMLGIISGSDLDKPEESFQSFGDTLSGIADQIRDITEMMKEVDKWGDKMSKITEIGQPGGIQKSIDDGGWWLPEGAKGGRGLIPWMLEGFPSERKKPDGSHALGLSYVPKNDYVANLHEGEGILDKQENAEYRRNKSGGGQSGRDININISHMSVRSDQDIHDIGKAFARELMIAGVRG
ncbi:hypothetical protein [uncultured Exiguobacterium sp.]|uniref:hypothetical protein n=1 Tax=uncultured Exiguobacterium sp. TaxID=202669 RepID=UPI0025E540D5|nr:hypothetical protein [uncultured Exiguobacterium sp.]